MVRAGERDQLLHPAPAARPADRGRRLSRPTVDDLVRADAALGDGGSDLFREANPDAIGNYDALEEGLAFDSQNRVVPTETSYISLVYSQNDIDAPKTLDDLLRPAYEGALLTQDPTRSETGLGFLLRTIENKGEDDYLEYWSALQDNGVQILGSWSDAYAAYSNGEASIVMSYATDQVFAARSDEDVSEHLVAFPNSQSIAYIAGIAGFAGSENTELVDRFTEFMLSPRVQSKVTVLNRGLPGCDEREPAGELRRPASCPSEDDQLQLRSALSRPERLARRVVEAGLG